MKVSQNDVDVIMSIGDSAALRSPQTTEKIIGGSKIIGARLMVYSVTSRWGVSIVTPVAFQVCWKWRRAPLELTPN